MKELSAAGIGATLSGILLHFISSTPQTVKDLSLVALGFFIADYLTGVAAAAARGELSSREARSRHLAKFMQFFGILSLGTGAAIVTNSWAWMIATLSAICSMEAISIIENVRGLQKAGVSLGPIAPLLDRLSHAFGDTPQSPGQSTLETTTRDQAQPISAPRTQGRDTTP